MNELEFQLLYSSNIDLKYGIQLCIEKCLYLNLHNTILIYFHSNIYLMVNYEEIMITLGFEVFALEASLYFRLINNSTYFYQYYSCIKWIKSILYLGHHVLGLDCIAQYIHFLCYLMQNYHSSKLYHLLFLHEYKVNQLF